MGRQQILLLSFCLEVFMSKLYDKYLKLKSSDNSKMYLFESGKFYIFIDSDAKDISKITTLKLTNLTSDIVKCGFPSNSLDKYIEIFNNLNLDIEVINKEKTDIDSIISKIKNIDINRITPIESLNILKELSEYINE